MATVLNTILIALAAYLGVGLVFGVAFIARGLGAVDPVARGSSWGFRLVILPGVAALWPLMLVRWRRAAVGEEGP